MSLSKQLYTEALLKSEEILSKSPLSQAAQALANGQTLNGNITLRTLRDIIPSVKQKADAEADPLVCILLLAETKADIAYRYYAINRVVRRLFKEGRYDRAVAAILKGGRGSDKADLYLKLASLTEEADQRERTRDLLENAYQAQGEESWEPANILANVAAVQFRIGNAGRALSILAEAENRLPFIECAIFESKSLDSDRYRIPERWNFWEGRYVLCSSSTGHEICRGKQIGKSNWLILAGNSSGSGTCRALR